MKNRAPKWESHTTVQHHLGTSRRPWASMHISSSVSDRAESSASAASSFVWCPFSAMDGRLLSERPPCSCRCTSCRYTPPAHATIDQLRLALRIVKHSVSACCSARKVYGCICHLVGG